RLGGVGRAGPRLDLGLELGPSSVAPITSALRRFRHEFEAKIQAGTGSPHTTEPVDAPVAEEVHS
ncbi:MAG: hypothetical protein AAGK32_01500, partial [Actinomycetota bacterium]